MKHKCTYAQFRALIKCTREDKKEFRYYESMERYVRALDYELIDLTSII